MQERIEQNAEGPGTIHYTSRRLIGPSASFAATFRSTGRPAPTDDLSRFLTERYALFVRRFGAVQVGEIHHRPWHLEGAEAEITENTLPQTFGFTLPSRPPFLHYSHEIEMEAWILQRAPSRP
jgi:uncharacterized protein YqjF (DUF2071 family)